MVEMMFILLKSALKIMGKTSLYFRVNVGEFALGEDKRLLKVDLTLDFFFHRKPFFPKSEPLNSGCILSASVAYL